MTDVVLVGCTKTKREYPAEARDLYDESPLFRKRRCVARLRGDWWGILSAEHGLVRPENWLEPYDTYIGNVDSEGWAEKVLDVLLDDLARHDDPSVRIFAGKKYVDPLVPDLEAEGYEVLDPLRGLMPGQRMSKLDDMAEETEQSTLVQTDGGRNSRSVDTGGERNAE